MLGKWSTQREYRAYVTQELQKRWSIYGQYILRYQDGLIKLWQLNFDELRWILGSYYAFIGRPAENQPEILRSLVLMTEYHEESFDLWVERLRQDDLLAITCGFVPGNTPGVGT